MHEDGVEVNVLEARDRLGGRVWTQDVEGAPVELGAWFFRGVQGSPLSDFSDAHGIADAPCSLFGAGMIWNEASASRVNPVAAGGMETAL